MPKRQASSPTRADTKRQKLSTPWFTKQGPALEAMQPGDVLLKRGSYEFNAYNRDEFLEQWATHADGPIYEVIMPLKPCRLYLDIESVAPEAEPAGIVVQKWLRGLVDIVETALCECGVPVTDAKCVLVTSDCRPTDGMWKRSFHLTWPNVVFSNNHTAMKGWITDHVMPLVTKNPAYQWIAQYKRGATVKYAVDEAVYSKYRAWRVSFARKKGKTALIPWNVVEWCPLELKDEADRHDFIDSTLCSCASLDDVSLVKSDRTTKKDGIVVDVDDTDAPRAPLPTGTHCERAFVQCALPLLTVKRATDRDSWMRVGFAVSTVFGTSDLGRDLFRLWSRRAPNYDQTACDAVYSGAQKCIGVKSVLKWLREDVPAGVASALAAQLITGRDEASNVSPPQGGKRVREGVRASEAKGFAKLTELLVKRGCTEKVQRFGDVVYGQHRTIPGALEKLADASDFVNRVLHSVDEFHAKPVMGSLLTWFQTQHHADFPLLTEGGMKRNICSFRDGQLDISDMTFTPTGDGVATPTFWYFDTTYNDITDSTPLWDNLLSTQIAPEMEIKAEEQSVGGREEPIALLESLIGRLFHAVGLDKWSVMPFILGDANTGKSTILHLVAKMFPAGSVANISSNHEKQFGLEKLVNARLILCMDLPDDMHKVLSQTEWQSCVSGEYVSVPRKNKVALSVPEWSAPFLWAGNNNPSYTDMAGSASRRLATYRFEQVITTRDTLLVPKILDTELVAVMLRCLRKYHDLRTRRTGQDFWRFAPQSMVEQRDRTATETNFLANFVANGDNFYDCVYQEGAGTPLGELKKAFTNHMQFNHPDTRVKWSSDYHALRSRGFLVKRSFICKICTELASVGTCGEHYRAGKNRKLVTIIHNLLLKRKDDINIY